MNSHSFKYKYYQRREKGPTNHPMAPHGTKLFPCIY